MTASFAPSAILIVEDEAPIRHFIRKILAKAGYVALEAANTSQAEAVVRSYPGKVRLAILDIVMPGGSGLDFANQLAIERPATKVLFVSGFGDSVAAESLGRGQPDAMLTKPFTGRRLLARVQELLGPNVCD